ncbi:MAG: hypothetical protein IPK15_08860 [Verrucomicrobia bacterium]|nr:hypothetical protein [Verrucomicrobiota bacterium]
MSRSQPGSNGAPKRGFSPGCCHRVHDAIQHRDRFAGIALTRARIRPGSPTTPVSSNATHAASATGHVSRGTCRVGWSVKTFFGEGLDLRIRLRKKVRVRTQSRVKFQTQNVFVAGRGMTPQQYVQRPHLIVSRRAVTNRGDGVIKLG